MCCQQCHIVKSALMGRLVFYCPYIHVLPAMPVTLPCEVSSKSSQARLERKSKPGKIQQKSTSDSTINTANKHRLKPTSLLKGINVQNTQTTNVVVFRQTYTAWEDNTWLRQKHSCRITPGQITSLLQKTNNREQQIKLCTRPIGLVQISTTLAFHRWRHAHDTKWKHVPNTRWKCAHSTRWKPVHNTCP